MEQLKSLLSRKFILAVVVLIACFVLTLTGETTYDQFQDLAKWIMGLYIAGNVAAKFGLN